MDVAVVDFRQPFLRVKLIDLVDVRTALPTIHHSVACSLAFFTLATVLQLFMWLFTG